jgi:hypothetical protein
MNYEKSLEKLPLFCLVVWFCTECDLQIKRTVRPSRWLRFLSFNCESVVPEEEFSDEEVTDRKFHVRVPLRKVWVAILLTWHM